MEEKCVVKITARGGAQSMHVYKWGKLMEKFTHLLTLTDMKKLSEGKAITKYLAWNCINKSIELTPLQAFLKS